MSPTFSRPRDQTGCMSSVPRGAVVRSARVATLLLVIAGRATLGIGKRLGGKPAEMVATELQARTADQIFKVLGELKGGAMKFGQALSVFEAALPDELAAPYRAALTKLQESAPPLPAESVHRVLVDQMGSECRPSFQSFEDTPAAAASIGQVHAAVWSDGRPVAVKIQYPGADLALDADLRTLQRFSRLLALVVPGVDGRALVGELREGLVPGL